MKTSFWGVCLLLFLGISIISCKGKMGNKGNTAGNEEQIEDGFTRGTITTSRADQGCPVLVKVEMEGQSRLHRPISLPEEFAEEGMKIKFKYRKSRAAQKDCEDGMPLIVSEVSKQK